MSTHAFIRRLLAALGYLWAAPVTLPAALLAALAACSGGRCHWRTGVLEASGGWPGWLLRRALPGFPIAAITLGHVVLASDADTLERTRRHERVHVAQYMRWGILFPFAYALASLVAGLRGRDAYRGNRFEVEAFRADELDT